MPWYPSPVPGSTAPRDVAVAAEFSNRNFRVNGLVPGSIDTPMLRILPTETLGHFAQILPMKRRGRGELGACLPQLTGQRHVSCDRCGPPSGGAT